MVNVEAIHKELLAAWGKPNHGDLNVVKSKLGELKAALNDPEVLLKLSDSASSTVHKDFFEITALFNVVNNDMKGFERAITDVHSFYECVARDSPSKYLMYGLHLMFLLAENRLSEFHMLLEQIDQSVQQKDAYICMPVKLEQSLVEGAYNKVILSESNLPTPYYIVFVRVLMSTVRNDIASCVEQSFKRIMLKDATSMLLFETPAQLAEFAKERRWTIEGDVVQFEALQAKADEDKPVLDTKRIAIQNIYYAKQLEMIV